MLSRTRSSSVCSTPDAETHPDAARADSNAHPVRCRGGGGASTLTRAMAAPRFAPSGARDDKFYSSPDVVPDAWDPNRPGIVDGLQPIGERMGAMGPDQGYALTIAHKLAPKLKLADGERLDDAIRGCVLIALRRASLFSRAPVVHDLHVAFTIWGYYDETPPEALLTRRADLFEGVGNVNQHYAAGRKIADLVPESTLRLTPAAAAAEYPAEWRALTGA